jgi:hypothetical protein
MIGEWSFNQLYEISWTTISAMSTLAAVGIALFLHYWQEKSKINVVIASGPRYGEGKKAIITIANQGNRAETIIRILYRKKENGKVYELIDRDIILPKTIPAHGIEYYDWPYLQDNSNLIDNIIVEDAIGRRWGCDKTSLKNAQKLLLNHRGGPGRLFDKDKSESSIAD